MHFSEPLFPPLMHEAERVLIQAELVEDRRVNVAEVVWFLDRLQTDRVGGPDHLAALTQHHAHQQLAAEATAGITTPDDDPDGPRADWSAELPE